jgi:hypothetical protein
MTVPSSTSSSDERLPRAPWLRTWALALALAVALLAGYEAFWRLRGVAPCLSDSPDLWALARRQVRARDPDAVVLLGASRFQVGLDLDALGRELGRRPVQLAFIDSDFRPVLEHLSRDRSFRGVVVCDFYPGMLSERSTLGSRDGQAELVKHYEQRTVTTLAECWLRLWCNAHLVSRRAELSLTNLAAHLKRGELPQPQTRFRLRTDRSFWADFSRGKPATWDYAPTGKVESDPQLVRRNLARLEELVSRLRARGGRVVFVRMPSTGGVRALEDDKFPRASEWDVLAAQPWAVTVHHADHPELCGYDCPDHSHLDCCDAARFSRALGRVLKDALQKRFACTGR